MPSARCRYKLREGSLNSKSPLLSEYICQTSSAQNYNQISVMYLLICLVDAYHRKCLTQKITFWLLLQQDSCKIFSSVCTEVTSYQILNLSMSCNLSAPSGVLIRAQEKKRLTRVNRIIFMTQEIFDVFVCSFQFIMLMILQPNTNSYDRIVTLVYMLK